MESTRRFTRIERNNQFSVEIGNAVVIQANILKKSLGQFETERVEALLIEALHEYMDSWNDPAVWSRIWSEISEEASREGIDAFEARKVARRLFHRLKEEINLKQDELERKERQRKTHENALALWVKNLDISDEGAEWNYDMWDEFLETLDAPVDMSYLEQTRDAFIKEAIIELQGKTGKSVGKWVLGLTVSPDGAIEFTPVLRTVG